MWRTQRMPLNETLTNVSVNSKLDSQISNSRVPQTNQCKRASRAKTDLVTNYNLKQFKKRSTYVLPKEEHKKVPRITKNRLKQSKKPLPSPPPSVDSWQNSKRTTNSSPKFINQSFIIANKKECSLCNLCYEAANKSNSTSTAMLGDAFKSYSRGCRSKMSACNTQRDIARDGIKSRSERLARIEQRECQHSKTEKEPAKLVTHASAVERTADNNIHSKGAVAKINQTYKAQQQNANNQSLCDSKKDCSCQIFCSAGMFSHQPSLGVRQERQRIRAGSSKFSKIAVSGISSCVTCSTYPSASTPTLTNANQMHRSQRKPNKTINSVGMNNTLDCSMSSLQVQQMDQCVKALKIQTSLVPNYNVMQFKKRSTNMIPKVQCKNMSGVHESRLRVPKKLLASPQPEKESRRFLQNPKRTTCSPPKFIKQSPASQEKIACILRNSCHDAANESDTTTVLGDAVRSNSWSYRNKIPTCGLKCDVATDVVKSRVDCIACLECIECKRRNIENELANMVTRKPVIERTADRNIHPKKSVEKNNQTLGAQKLDTDNQHLCDSERDCSCQLVYSAGMFIYQPCSALDQEHQTIYTDSSLSSTDDVNDLCTVKQNKNMKHVNHFYQELQKRNPSYESLHPSQQQTQTKN